MWTRRECTACSSSGGTGNARNLQGALRTSTHICFRNEFENLECSMCTAVPKARRSWEGTTLSGNVRASWRDREKAGASSVEVTGLKRPRRLTVSPYSSSDTPLSSISK